MAIMDVDLRFNAHHPDLPPFYKSIFRFLNTTDHREIGMLYIAFAFVNFVLAGLMALLIRFQLAGVQVTNSSGYSQLFTTHGTAMIFLFIFPLGIGFGNYLIPILIKAEDMYWPRWNNIAFWMLIPGALFVWMGYAGTGWTLYPPLSTSGSASGDVDLWLVGLLLLGTSSIIGAVNFLLTIWKLRGPEIKFTNMNLFVWATLFTSLIQIVATPVLTVGLVLLLFDRNFLTMFFSGISPGDPLLFQHVFWFYSHPAVYIMVLPAMGLISNIIPIFSRTKIFGYVSMVFSLGTITLLGFVVWGHHMYVTGLNLLTTISFSMLTYAIALPSGIKMFNWLFTMHAGRVKFEIPMMFALTFLVSFLFGGLTGVMLNVLPWNTIAHDTYWVVGHFHFVVWGGTVAAMFGAIYYFFPYFTGRQMDRTLGWWHFWTFTIGNFITFTAMGISGFLGQNRRYYSPPSEFLIWNQIATIGAIIIALSSAFFLYNIVSSFIAGRKSTEDPWGLETAPAGS